MIVYRLVRVVLQLLVGLWTCATVFPLVDAAGRERRIQRWSKRLMSICRVKVEFEFAPGYRAAPRAVLVANHISWLDIFVINSLQPRRFVAKSDIRDWPLIGWLVAAAGTIFIARGKARDVRRIYQGLVHSIEGGEHVAFFPEGTTGAQGALLPFHANLFEAAVNGHAAIQPCALAYLDANGRPHPAVDFLGEMTFAQSMLAILKSGPIQARLIMLAPIETAGRHRRELAAAAHAAIAEALGVRPE